MTSARGYAGGDGGRRSGGGWRLTSYPLSSKNSARYEPSCPVMPVISATLGFSSAAPPARVIDKFVSRVQERGKVARSHSCSWNRPQGHVQKRAHAEVGCAYTARELKLTSIFTVNRAGGAYLMTRCARA